MPPRFKPKTTIDGRYVLEAHIGAGGFGEVWRARNRVGQLVAIKLSLDSQPTEEAILRMRREAHISGQLGSEPCFVRARDVGKCATTKVHFIEYDLVDGATALIVRTGPLQQRLRVLRDASRAVARAHELGVVHRDVKPTNFLVGRDGIVRLHDFGLARFLKDTPLQRDDETKLISTRMRVGFGTPAYASLEQLESAKDADHRTDVFALGATLFEALMGDVWFKGDINDVMRRLMSIQVGRHPAPSAARSVLLRALPEREREWMVRLCATAMAVDRERRVQTAREFADGLDRMLGVIDGGAAPPVKPATRQNPVPAPARTAGPAALLWQRAQAAPNALQWLLENTRAESVKLAVRRVVPARGLEDIPATDGKIHYIERLMRHIRDDGDYRAVYDEPSLRKAWDEHPDLLPMLVAAEQSGAVARPSDDIGPQKAYSNMEEVFAAGLGRLDRESLLNAARRLGGGSISESWTSRRIAARLAECGEKLVEVLTLDDLRELAKHHRVSSSGRKAEVFSRLSCAVASRVAVTVPMTVALLAQALSRPQLVAAAERLGHDIRTTWTAARVAEQLVRDDLGAGLEVLSAAELKTLLVQLRLPVSGTKLELVARVALALSSPGSHPTRR